MSNTLELHGYADDHALKNSLPGNNREAEINTIMVLEDSLRHVKIWMDGNRLKMNDSKTEFIQFGSRQQLWKCTIEIISVNDCDIPKVNVIKIFGNLSGPEPLNESAY